MRPNITRRDVLKLVGGSAVGFFFTPMPWKLLDDSAIWTQNWSLTPALPRGPLTETLTACTLCGGGCAVRAKCAGGVPYALAGPRDHPLSRGHLCAAGLAGHHMAFHPLRLASPVRFTEKGEGGRMEELSFEEAFAQVGAQLACTEGGVAILDAQPGRAVSRAYREFLDGMEDGRYLAPPSREDATLAALQSMLGEGAPPLGFDLDRTGMVLSFGAPLLEGWGTPGRIGRLFGGAGAARPTLVQAESRQSRTALGADRWIPIRPGSEYQLALSLANVLLEEQWYDRSIEHAAADLEPYRLIVSAYRPEWTVEQTGVRPDHVRELAASLSRAPAAIVLSGADPGAGPMSRDAEYAIAGLNLLLGSVGRSGGIVARRPMPGDEGLPGAVRDLRDVPDRSLRLLIVDAAQSGYAVPWGMLERKLIAGTGMLVSLSPLLDRIAAHADLILPAPAPYEALCDVAASPDGERGSFMLSNPLLKPKPGAVDPAALIARLSAPRGTGRGPSTGDELLKERVRSIHASRRGGVASPDGSASRPAAEFAKPEDLWTALSEGGTWLDDPAEQPPLARFTLATSVLRSRIAGASPEEGLLLMPYGWKGAPGDAEIPPVMSKLFQESSLRSGSGVVYIHPATAASAGIEDRDSATLTTEHGSVSCVAIVDPTVPPGTVQAPVGPSPNGWDAPPGRERSILDICGVRADGTWRSTNVNVRKA